MLKYLYTSMTGNDSLVTVRLESRRSRNNPDDTNNRFLSHLAFHNTYTDRKRIRIRSVSAATPSMMVTRVGRSFPLWAPVSIHVRNIPLLVYCPSTHKMCSCSVILECLHAGGQRHTSRQFAITCCRSTQSPAPNICEVSMYDL